MHGTVGCSVGIDGVFSYQDTCDVSCDPGYILTGSGTRTCLSNGSLSGMDSSCRRRGKCQISTYIASVANTTVYQYSCIR